MVDQNRLLTALAEHQDWETACTEAGIGKKRLQHWLQQDPAFRKEYMRLFGGLLDATKAHLSSLLPKAAEVVADALAANRPIGVECPECHHEFGISAPAWAVRLRAMEDILKQHGQLVQKHEISATVTHLTLEDQLAIAAIRRGLAVPPSVVERLRSEGLVKDDGTIVEGEVIQPD